MSPANLKAPFPWFGGKSRASDLIWSRLGDVRNYVEPFAGSMAVLLSRPHWPFDGALRTETVNDLDCYVANFWRAITADPSAVCEHADNPVNEADLHARHTWLHGQAERVERMKTDPDYFDPRIAGYWVWGLSCWIGDNFCRPQGLTAQRVVEAKRPHLASAGKGINAQRVQRRIPDIGDHGKGIHRQLPRLTGRQGIQDSRLVSGACAERREQLLAYFAQLADRLRGVRVCCGEWDRVLGPSPTFRLGMTGVILDPPYEMDGRDKVYGSLETGVWDAVCAWCAANGDNPLMRIALCGYEGGWNAPAGWECVEWKAGGGYGNQSAENDNRHRERVWFSPACIRPSQDLFDCQP